MKTVHRVFLLRRGEAPTLGIILEKIQWKENLTFADVMKVIKERLQGMYDRY